MNTPEIERKLIENARNQAEIEFKVRLEQIHKEQLEKKNKEIERLNNIINELEDSIVGKINVLYQVKDKEIERLTNIINELEDSIVGKINVLYQVRGQSNAIQELDILLRQLRELKGDSSNVK